MTDPEFEFEAPPRALVAAVIATLVFLVMPLSYTVHYTRIWSAERMGKTIDEQRALFINKSWFQLYFRAFVRELDERLPEDAKVLVTPTRRGPDGRSLVEETGGKARWFLFLNHYLYPRTFYVRKPALASGTLVDYPSWLTFHWHRRDVDEVLNQDLETMMARRAYIAREKETLTELGVDYELVYGVTRFFNPDYARLFELKNGERAHELELPGRLKILRPGDRGQSEENEAVEGDEF